MSENFFNLSSIKALGENEQLINHHGVDTSGIKSPSKLFDILGTYMKGDSPWYFRGEPKHYEHPCLNGFARDYYYGGYNSSDLEPNIPLQHDANGEFLPVTCFTKQEREIVEGFAQKSASLEDDFFNKLVTEPDSPDYISFAQHYGEKTRLLDVTRDPLTALYFACDQDISEHGYVWCIPSPPNLHNSHKPNNYLTMFDAGLGDQQGLAFYEAGRINEYQRKIKREALLECTFAIELPPTNKRIIAQSGAFLWHPNPLTKMTSGAFKVRVDKNSKEDILSLIAPLGKSTKKLFPK